ncbi:zinc finger BED domain-containing protein 5-like [Oratosquilla oratoria]|uniref:zinc finger BED domain-containing protein 5-like n=1 Tax=Oratosquilla oratoria TaxID=337810 RepID=UPI003F7707B2
MDADFHGLLLHSEVRWLSRGAVLNRVFALRRELAVFLSTHKSELCIYFEDKSWMLKLAYLSDISQHLNVLNKSMQGLELCILNVQDKVRAFMQKLSLWESKCQEGVTEMFPFYHQECMTSSEDITAIIVSHLSYLQGYFREYYPELENSHMDWIRNPFVAGVSAHLDMKSQEELIEISNDGGMKIKFSALPLPEFWIYSRTEYHALAEKALKYILPFATTYLCEKGFSTLTILKTKHRARLQVDNDMRLALTSSPALINCVGAIKPIHPTKQNMSDSFCV